MRTEKDVRVAGRRRVAPLAPDDRRSALIDATLPLLCEHGMAVTSRQIADAAGVAEGTIFRVFPDKTALIIATALRGTDPDRGVAAIRSIEPAADLRTRLTVATRMMADGLVQVGRLHLVLRELMTDPEHVGAVSGHLQGSREAMTSALAELIEPDAALLRISPIAAARIILVMIFTTNGNLFADQQQISAPDLVSVLLDGLLAPRPDAGPPRDHAQRPDAEPARDNATRTDAEPPRDNAAPPDAGPPRNHSSSIDGALPADGAPSPDSPPATVKESPC